MTSNEPTAKPLPVKTFKVHPDGKITGSEHVKPGDTIVVEYSSSSNHYTGKIYADHNGHDGSRQLVGSDEIVVGTPYNILPAAGGRDYMITTTQPRPRHPTGVPSPAGAEPPPATTNGNGDLYVGSGE
jgi:hypothetical protein